MSYEKLYSVMSKSWGECEQTEFADLSLKDAIRRKRELDKSNNSVATTYYLSPTPPVNEYPIAMVGNEIRKEVRRVLEPFEKIVKEHALIEGLHEKEGILLDKVHSKLEEEYEYADQLAILSIADFCKGDTFSWTYKHTSKILLYYGQKGRHPKED